MWGNRRNIAKSIDYWGNWIRQHKKTLAYKGKNNTVVYTPHGYAHILMGPGKKSKVYKFAEKVLGNRALTLTCCESEDEEAKKFSKRTAYLSQIYYLKPCGCGYKISFMRFYNRIIVLYQTNILVSHFIPQNRFR